MKKIVILTIAAFFTFSAFAGAGNSNDRTSNWHQSSKAPSTGFITDVDEESVDPNVPISDGLLIMTLLSGGYALLRNRNWKSVKFRIK